MDINNNFATFDLTLFTDSAFSERFQVKYFNERGKEVILDQNGKTFLMQLRGSREDASAALTLNVQPFSGDTTFLEITSNSDTIGVSDAGTYYFSIMDVTDVLSNGDFLVAHGKCEIIANPTR